MLPPPEWDEQTEEQKIEAWRLEQFLDLGYATPYAELLVCTRVDHHELAALVRRGASLELAARILI